MSATHTHDHAHHDEHGQPRQRPPFNPKRRVRLEDGRFVCGDHRDTASIQGAMYSGRRCALAIADEIGAPANDPQSIDGVIWVGANGGDLLGTAVAGVMDVTTDGLDDVVLGAPGADPESHQMSV